MKTGEGAAYPRPPLRLPSAWSARLISARAWGRKAAASSVKLPASTTARKARTGTFQAGSGPAAAWVQVSQAAWVSAPRRMYWSSPNTAEI